MELQATPSRSARSVNYSVCPDGRNVVLAPPEQRNFEENQLTHTSSSPKKTGYGCRGFLVCLGIVLLFIAVIFIGIYFGGEDGVNSRGQSLEEGRRPAVYIGLGFFIPGILVGAAAIPFIFQAKKSHQRRVEMRTYEELPNINHPVAS